MEVYGRGGGVQIKIEMHVENLFRLDGRVALITGGASGIGAATSGVCASAGAKVIIVDLDRERAEHLAMETPGAEVRICDITCEETVKQMFAGVRKLDIVVNNAGSGLVGSIDETSRGDFEKLMRVNVEGTFLVTRSALPLLIESHGAIVNIGSVAGLVGVKRRFAYCATKGAVIAMTRQLAVDYPRQIRANCICPGTVDTPSVEGYLEKHHKHEKGAVRAELEQRQPIAGLGKAPGIARIAPTSPS